MEEWENTCRVKSDNSDQEVIWTIHSFQYKIRSSMNFLRLTTPIYSQLILVAIFLVLFVQ